MLHPTQDEELDRVYQGFCRGTPAGAVSGGCIDPDGVLIGAAYRIPPKGFLTLALGAGSWFSEVLFARFPVLREVVSGLGARHVVCGPSVKYPLRSLAFSCCQLSRFPIFFGFDGLFPVVVLNLVVSDFEVAPGVVDTWVVGVYPAAV